MFKKGRGRLARNRVRQAVEADESKDGRDMSSAGFKRMQTDFASLELPKNVEIVHKDPEKPDIMDFILVIDVKEGLWAGGKFRFSFSVSKDYPHQEPKVRCLDKVYHPNIDLEGHVCVNMLRPWKPIYTLSLIMFSLLFLFDSPNPGDPLNKDAAQVMREAPERFKANHCEAKVWTEYLFL